MPFPLIPTALSIGFLLVWALIGGMLFRDGQLAARSDRESELTILPLTPDRSVPEGSARLKRAKSA